MAAASAVTVPAPAVVLLACAAFMFGCAFALHPQTRPEGWVNTVLMKSTAETCLGIGILVVGMVVVAAWL